MLDEFLGPNSLIYRVLLLASFLIGVVWIVGGFFDIFPDFAEKNTPHTSIVNSGQIEGRAPVNARKKASRNKEKNGMKTKTKK